MFLARSGDGLVGHVGVLIEALLLQISDVRFYSVDKFANDCNFVKHSLQQSGFLANALGKHLLSFVSRLPHALKISEGLGQYCFGGLI